MQTDFPMTEAESGAFLAGVAEKVQAVHDLESEAVAVLKDAVA